MIDWWSSESHLLLNPRMPESEQKRLERLRGEVPSLSGHVWLATSGTTGALKLTALSKQALLASAEGVNQHLQATAGDVWCCVLPEFHVGGLSIHARAALSKARVVSAEWDAPAFRRTVESEGVTLASLVPAHVRDLVRAGLTAPSTMRAVVVGGGALSPDLYKAGRDLGWPLLPSYGLTEVASQVATATVESPELTLLPHVDCRIVEGRIVLRSAALLSGYALYEGDKAVFMDPRIDGWFMTEDLGTLNGRLLSVLGRAGEFVKIGGESVDLTRLDAILEGVRGELDAAIFPVPDERLGWVIHLAAVGGVGGVVEAFNAQVLPYERIRGVAFVEAIPRSPLGKLLRSRLTAALGS